MADFTTFGVDAVVNAANVELKHSGGLAQALNKAWGPQIQNECNQHITEFGPLKTGKTIVTNAGNLNCTKIIHAVGPPLPHKPNNAVVSTAKRKLRQAVQSILKTVETNNFRSIAIPALSSGIFNFPLKVCCGTITRTIKDFYEEGKSQDTPLTINLVNNDQKTVVQGFFPKGTWQHQMYQWGSLKRAFARESVKAQNSRYD